MMTEQLGFSVLSAPLASLDRRALSQAWYSALHLGTNNARTSSSAPHANTFTASAVHERQTQSSERAPTHAQDPARPHERGSRSLCGDVTQADRRALRSPLARKIEGAFLRPTKPLHRATFTIDGTARVHISIQNSGFGMRLVAVCAPAARPAVAKALDEARYALAARGISIGVALSAGADAD